MCTAGISYDYFKWSLLQWITEVFCFVKVKLSNERRSGFLFTSEWARTIWDWDQSSTWGLVFGHDLCFFKGEKLYDNEILVTGGQISKVNKVCTTKVGISHQKKENCTL